MFDPDKYAPKTLDDFVFVNSRANPARDSRHNPASRNAESRSLNG